MRRTHGASRGATSLATSSTRRRLDAYVQAVCLEYHYLRVRRLSWTTVLTILVIAATAGFTIWVASWLEHWFAWIVASGMTLFCLMLELVGIQQIYEVPDGDEISPKRAYRTQPPKSSTVESS